MASTACASSAIAAVAFSSQKSGSIVGSTKASFVGGKKLRVSKLGSAPSGSRSFGTVCVAADPDRPIWFPGSTPPEWLDGSLPGDFGFDPLGLGSDPETLKWNVQAELVHCRWAMLGAAGIFIPEFLTKIGILNTPSWYTAGEQEYFTDKTTLFIVELIFIGWAEGRRWADILKPGSVNTDPIFPNNKLTGTDVGYPGGLWFDPLGWGSGSPAKLKQLRHHFVVQMSLVDDSPVSSSSSDDFASFLDGELDSTSDTQPQEEEEEEKEKNDDDDDDDDYDWDQDDHETYKSLIDRTKRRKISYATEEPNGSTSHIEKTDITEASVKKVGCAHPGFIGGMCIKCGEKRDNQSGVAFKYIHKDLTLTDDEVTRLRDRDLKNLLRHRKLYLVLDLDHTLLNSTRFSDVTQEEGYLMNPDDPMQGKLKGSLFKLPFMHMVTKLRPFVHDFLKEASNLFEMYIYTMGERSYALEMANLLDPGMVYFNSKVIAQGDCTTRHQKGLDVVLGQESAVLILDDTESVWSKHKDNLISMERYHFFASSCKQFGYKAKSLSELRSDESDVDGALATVLKVLKRVHSMFYDPELGENFAGRDARQMLRAVRGEVLRGCKVVFTRVFPTKFPAEHHHLWMLAERLGATCSTEVDPSVTHVISTDAGTEKSRWAVQEKKFLVEPRWLEAANFLWQRQPEEMFPVAVKEVKDNH